MIKYFVYMVVACLTVLLNGCATLQYIDQAAQGQAEVLERARPISEVIVDPTTPLSLVDKLKLATELRAFAISNLKLPDNASYTRYADLGRPYVVWNVVSTPALSLTPEPSCFPIAGCFSYRGYYVEPEARAWADKQIAKGDDVFLYGVPAYSTLGWFEDPLLNSTARYSETNLARLIFHELSHQVLYVKGDSSFNEAFATAVELEGIERWLANRNDAALTAQYRQSEARQAEFQALMASGRNRLRDLYKTDKSDAQKREEKLAIQADLVSRYHQLKASWQGYAGYDQWFDPAPNNAHFASLSTYHALVPAFTALIREKQGDMPAFFSAVKEMAKKDRATRNAMLAALNVTAGELQAKAPEQMPGTATPATP